jgi:O-antigen/teichoic acid export membrane protein
LTTCIRIILIQRQAPLVAFAWAGLAEGVFSSVGLAIAYQTSGKWLAKWRFCITCAKQLLLDSFPLIFSSIMVMVYMRIDQVMLAEMLGDNEVGIYSAAVRLAEAWYFIPMAIVASVFPLIVEAKKHSEADFYGKLQKLYNLMALLAYLVIVPTTLLSGWIVHLIFGDAYAKAAFMLAILVWASLFVNLGLVKGAFLTAMNWTKLYFATIFLGCFVNIILNFVLIPTHGGVGAAIATCIAQGFANYVTCFLLKPLNKTGSMLTKAIFLIKNGT